MVHQSNFSGVVDGADLGALLAAWGTAEFDLDGNGVVSGSDLGLLPGAWDRAHSPFVPQEPVARIRGAPWIPTGGRRAPTADTGRCGLL